MIKLRSAILAAFVYLSVVTLKADNASAMGAGMHSLFDATAKDAATQFTPIEQSETQVSASASAGGKGVDVTIQPGNAEPPGLMLKPQGAPCWDLSVYGDAQATITNTSAQKITLTFRVDNEGSWITSPWNSETATFNPGETKPIKIIFGYGDGHRPGFALKSSAVTEVVFLSGKVVGSPLTFRIDSIVAGGVAGEKPPVNPDSVRTTPKHGLLLGAGAQPLDAAKNLVSQVAQCSLVDASGGQNLKIVFPGGTDKPYKPWAGIRPEAGKWILTDSNEVRAKVRNDGPSPITPTLYVDSDGGGCGATAAAPSAPGAETELVASYANPQIWKNTPPAIAPDPGTGNKFTSQRVNRVLIMAVPDSSERTLTVESIKADQSPYSAPDWLGARPPVDGDWTKTFDDEFDGTTLNDKNWRIDAENWWDSRSHFTKEEIVVGGGTVTLHYEKKTGHPNDDPTKRSTNYATGYLDTYGKWVQRYGYFEARLKLPKAPGLWPAFWLTPDRGVAAGPQWKRQDTGNGGMEFDICEFLSGWGPFRYNIAMHWDGYGAYHKTTGQDTNYVQPDKDGFINAGLLWLPGKAIYYCNGKEILHYENDRVAHAPCDIMFTIVSGGWDNLPLDDAKLPDDFVIDYVRVWQRKDLASAVDGFQTVPAPAPTPPATP